jgi:hypothetical protein
VKPIILLIAATALALPKLSLGEDPRKEIDTLPAQDVETILQTLQTHYFDPAAVNPEARARATLQGLIDRLEGGAEIRTKTQTETAESPFRAETVQGEIAYIRLGSITPANAEALTATLEQYKAKPPHALVLDLRATPPSTDYALAAEIIGRFCPRDRILFSLRTAAPQGTQNFLSKDDPLFSGTIAVVVSAGNRGAAEVIAASLRLEAAALIIGAKTVGDAVLRAEFPLEGDRVLSVAVAQAVLPGETTIHPHGVTPDIEVAVDEKTERELLHSELEQGIGPFVFDKERLHMNEAALVSGYNPEIDAALRARTDPPTPKRDATLQRAFDFLNVAAFYEKKLSGPAR